MWQSINLIFNVLGGILLFQFLWYKASEFRSWTSDTSFWRFERHKYVLTVGGFLLLSFGLIEFVLPAESVLVDQAKRLQLSSVLGISAAFSISLIWTIYLRKLDIFDPERWSNIFIVFLMACGTTWLVFPISYFNNAVLGFSLNGGLVNDFVYCTVGIGMVEEFVKLLPLLVIVQYRKVVREPYDFVLYASVAALGFAFIENAMYITKTNFYAINGRALTATVAHMTFSSVIGYGVMVSIYKKHWTGWRFFVGAFLLASLMHGFYDFWLINPTAQQYNGFSLLFFLLTTHFWFTMKNKTINASRYFDPHRKLINDRLRYFLIFWLTAILMGSAVIIAIFHGRDMANSFLRGQIYAFGFLLYYLSFSFSRFRLSPKVLSAGERLFSTVIPKEPRREDVGWK